MKRIAALIALALLPAQAWAHGGLPVGGGGFNAGLAHPVLAVEQFLALLAFGLLLGQQPGPFARSPLAVLAAGLAIGLAAGPIFDGLTLMTLAIALIFGGLLAAALRIAVWGLAAMAAALGVIVGADTDLAAGPPGDMVALVTPFAGVLIGVFLIVLNAAALASLARRPPLPVALRVAGSWIAAIALMVLALRLRGLTAV